MSLASAAASEAIDVETQSVEPRELDWEETDGSTPTEEECGGTSEDDDADGLSAHYDMFVALPRDVLSCRVKGRRLRAREIYLLITLYRMAARHDRPSVSCTPQRLVLVTGISKGSLSRMLGVDGAVDDLAEHVPPRLFPWIQSVKVRDNVRGDRVWDLLLTPLDAIEQKGFLRVPYWWLWYESWETTADMNGRKVDPDDPAIFAALAIAHVGVGHRTSRLGKQGLATVAGVGRTTMTRALADAECKGWIRVAGSKGGPGRRGGPGGKGKAIRQVRIRPSVAWVRAAGLERRE